MKKSLLILIIIGSILIVATGIFFAWKNTQKIITPPGLNNFPSVGSPAQSTTTEKNINKVVYLVSQEGVLDYWIYRKNGAEDVYYINKNGDLAKVGKDSDEIILEEAIFDFKYLESNTDGSLILFGDEVNKEVNTHLYNVDQKILTDLSKNLTNAVFSPDGKKIAALAESAEGSVLEVFNIGKTLSNPEKLINLPVKDSSLAWSQTDNILILPKPSALVQDSVWSFNLKTRKLSKIINEKNGILINFDKNTGNGIMLSSSSGGKNPILNLINFSGNILANLNFLSLPNKCTFDWPKIYCAIPNSFPKKTILPDDYLKHGFYTSDGLIRIDTEDNSVANLPLANISGLDVDKIRNYSNFLMFLDRKSTRLYRIDLNSI